MLGAVENEQAKEFIPSAIENGAIVIDNSSAYRMADDVPLIVPEVNPEAVETHKAHCQSKLCNYNRTRSSK